MTSYHGAATVIAPDGNRTAVYADLESTTDPRDGTVEWMGELDGELPWAELADAAFEIEIAGERRTVMIIREEAPDSGRTQILGVGPPPFGD